MTRLGPILLLASMPALAEPHVVEVTVAGVRSDKGDVLVAICDRATFLAPTCAYRGRAPAQVGSVMVRVPNVAPGVYAVQAYQDENRNGRLDRNLFGLPAEGLGFSRDARMNFGPPRFDDAAVAIGDNAAATVTLHYYD